MVGASRREVMLLPNHGFYQPGSTINQLWGCVKINGWRFHGLYHAFDTTRASGNLRISWFLRARRMLGMICGVVSLDQNAKGLRDHHETNQPTHQSSLAINQSSKGVFWCLRVYHRCHPPPISPVSTSDRENSTVLQVRRPGGV